MEVLLNSKKIYRIFKWRRVCDSKAGEAVESVEVGWKDRKRRNDGTKGNGGIIEFRGEKGWVGKEETAGVEEDNLPSFKSARYVPMWEEQLWQVFKIRRRNGLNCAGRGAGRWRWSWCVNVSIHGCLIRVDQINV